MLFCTVSASIFVKRLQHVISENTCLLSLTIMLPVPRTLMSARVPNVALSFWRIDICFAVFCDCRVDSRLVTNAQSSDTSCFCSHVGLTSRWRCRFRGCLIKAWEGVNVDEVSVRGAVVAQFLFLVFAVLTVRFCSWFREG